MNPCKECPWRRSSTPGYLGGNSCSTYVNLHRAQQPIPCHMQMQKLCRGSLIAMRNAAALPRDPELAVEVKKAEPDRENVFSHWTQFQQHHQGEP